MIEMDLAGLSVMVAMPVHRDLPIETGISLGKTAAMMEARGVKYELNFQIGSSLVEAARTKCVHNFLQSSFDRLFWVDSDIVWNPDDFSRLLALSTKLPVVGAVYPIKEETKTPFRFSFEGKQFEADEFGCFSVNGMGLKVIQELSDKAPKVRFPDIAEPIPHLFRCDIEGGYFRGEDIAFFSDIRGLGYPVKIDPTIKLGHVGTKTYTARLMDFLKKET
jgi:hypothetical protein